MLRNSSSYIWDKGKGKGRAIPVQNWTDPFKVAEGWDSKISRQSVHEVARLSGLRTDLEFIFVRCWIYLRVIGRPEGLGNLKIEPATFRLVVQCLNHLCHRVPQLRIVSATKVMLNNSIFFRIGSAQSYYYATLKLKFIGCVKNSSVYKDTMDINLTWIYSLYFILRLGKNSSKHKETYCLTAHLSSISWLIVPDFYVQ